MSDFVNKEQKALYREVELTEELKALEYGAVIQMKFPKCKEPFRYVGRKIGSKKIRLTGFLFAHRFKNGKEAEAFLEQLGEIDCEAEVMSIDKAKKFEDSRHL